MDKPVWLPLQTIYHKELLVADWLRREGIAFYIPMAYELRPADGGEEVHRTLVPAVHNLLFIRHPYDEAWCRRFVQQAPLPVYFLKRERQGGGYCTVGDKEMQDFMQATDPEIQGTRFVSPEMLRGKKDVRVRVLRKGPLYGVTGRFVRFGGRHYIAIEVPGSAALLKVSLAWCEAVDEEGAPAGKP